MTQTHTGPRGLNPVVVAGEVILSWSAAIDNTWVETYEIHRNGVPYASTGDTSFTDDASHTPGECRVTWNGR